MGSCMLVCGPHTSGKTVFILQLIDAAREVFDIPPTKVFWCYGQRTALHEQLKSRNFNMIQGIPPNFDFVTPNSLVMLDDLMVEGGNNANVTNLFIKGAHHVPCFVICTSQNIFAKGAENRNRQLNTQYLVLFKNTRDVRQIQYLENQMYPHSKHFLVKAYQDATAKPYTYLFLDSHQITPATARVRARILPSQRPMTVFVDKRLFGGVTTSKFLKQPRIERPEQLQNWSFG